LKNSDLGEARNFACPLNRIAHLRHEGIAAHAENLVQEPCSAFAPASNEIAPLQIQFGENQTQSHKRVFQQYPPLGDVGRGLIHLGNISAWAVFPSWEWFHAGSSSSIIVLWFAAPNQGHMTDTLTPSRSIAPPGSDAILDQVASATYATDADGRITYFNSAAADLWGIEPILGVTQWCGSWRLYWPDGRALPHDECPMALCLKGNRPLHNVEVVIERPDGARRQFLVNPRPIHDDHGVLIGAVNTLVDLTKVRSTQHALEAAQLFSQQILSNSPDCIKVLDLDGKLRSINQCGCISLEVDDPEEACGLSYFEFWEGSDQNVARAAAEKARKEGAGQFTAQYTSASGRQTLWEEMISAIRGPDGKPTGLLVISRDITERQRAHDEVTRRLRQQRAVSELGSFALQEDRVEIVMQRAVEVAADVLEVPLTKILRFTDHADRLLLQAGVGWMPGLVGSAHVGVDLDSQAGFTLSSDAPVIVENLKTERRFNGPALLHEHEVHSGMSVKIAGASGRPFGVFGAHSRAPRKFDSADVDFLVALANVVAGSARQADAQERRKLLAREMAHRSGNVLQLATAIFQQTLKTTPDIEEAKDKFTARLRALSRANLLLATGGWGESSLRRLVEDTLEPFLDKVEIDGRDIMLASDLCFDLGLLLHELSTNSAKYGAFSDRSGRAEISWRVERSDDKGPTMQIAWRDKSEKVGPRRSLQTGTGFGAKLLTQIVECKWRGTLEVRTEPYYECLISLPLADLREPRTLVG
jgi:PAS domain S-box-containing protein